MDEAEERLEAKHYRAVIREVKGVIVDMEFHLLEAVLKKDFDAAYKKAIQVQEAYEWIDYFRNMLEFRERGE